jgi:hypothetical protein
MKRVSQILTNSLKADVGCGRALFSQRATPVLYLEAAPLGRIALRGLLHMGTQISSLTIFATIPQFAKAGSPAYIAVV